MRLTNLIWKTEEKITPSPLDLELIPEVDPEKIKVDVFRQAFRELAQMLPREPVDHIEYIKSPGTQCEIPARTYTPASGRNSGDVVYFHGGGFVIGDIESHDPLCRALANASRSVVISVDYRPT